jgi:predicted nucleic acid-binding protein
VLVHLDTDFLVVALARSGRERRRMLELADSDATLEMSAVAWYEFRRGPRTHAQLAVARGLFDEHRGIVPFSEEIAARAADIFRRLGSPRRRAADVAIGVTAVVAGASLLTRNRRDFSDIPDLAIDLA